MISIEQRIESRNVKYGKRIVNQSHPDQPRLIFGLRKNISELGIWYNLFILVFHHFKNPLKCLSVLRRLVAIRKQVLGDFQLQKFVMANGKYYWDLYTPGCKSNAFTKYMEGEINRFEPLNVETNQFTHVFMAITKKCGMRCEHCFEWDALNGKEKLTKNDLQFMISKLNKIGVGQVQFSGGEPLLRIDDLINVLSETNDDIEYWVNTSGHGLTKENAKRLHDAGLTGVLISLDHFDDEQHNHFRGHKNAFYWAMEGVKNALENKLIPAFSICVTKSFATRENLIKYATLAKELGVYFIQILEPKAVGHYKGKDIALEPDHIKILESFYLDLNYDKKFNDFPLITYHGYHQRRVGCFASGNRSFYIDTDGDVHSCPFCHSKSGSFLNSDHSKNIEQLKQKSCQSFQKALI